MRKSYVCLYFGTISDSNECASIKCSHQVDSLFQNFYVGLKKILLCMECKLNSLNSELDQ